MSRIHMGSWLRPVTDPTKTKSEKEYKNMCLIPHCVVTS